MDSYSNHEILNELHEICTDEGISSIDEIHSTSGREFNPSAVLFSPVDNLDVAPGPSNIDTASIIWNYGHDGLLPYSEEVIACDDLAIQDPAGQLDSIYYPEPSTSVEEQHVLYEEITKARCIDCDKILDISLPKEDRKHNCIISKRFSCDKCGLRFNMLPNLQVHNLMVHAKQEDFIPGTDCGLCENKYRKKFQRFSAYVAHLKTHNRNDNFTCSTCGEEFEYNNLFNRHRRIVHGVGENTKKALSSSELGYCNKCDFLMEQSKVENHRIAHNAHLRIDKKENEPAAESHKKKITNDNRRYTCEQCQKAFVRPSELKRHMGVHERKEIWKCFQCNKIFSHQSGLRSHKKVFHSEEKPKFVCPVCGMTFNKRSNCDRHVKDIHPLNTQKVLLECTFCSCQFKNIGVLNRHLIRIHKAPKLAVDPLIAERIVATTETNKNNSGNPKDTLFPHKCFKCDKRFKLRSSLKVHLDVHARKEIDDPVLTDPKCPICLKHVINLKRHLLIHQNGYECPDCCQKFHSIHRLDRHKCYRAVIPNVAYQQDILVNPTTIKTTKIPSKSYFCKQCPRSFFCFKAFKEHKAIHSGMRPHLCWSCHKAFRTADLLAMHKEIHSKDPIYCEYCSLVLYGRAHYIAHLRAVHQNRQTTLPSSSTLLPNRGVGISSSQSEYCADRGEPLEGFRTRAQSADIEPREMDGTTWIPMGNTETVMDRSLRCPLCCHQFASVAHLTQHFANTQNERDHSFTVVQCPLCDMSLQGSAEAFQHFCTVHTYVFHDTHSVQNAVYGPIEEARFEIPSTSDKKHQCQICSAAFQKPSDLQRHIRIHTGEKPFECEICSRRFNVKSSLTSHVKIHLQEDPEHECSLCSTKSALALHLRLHTGEKPLKCRHCSMFFRSSAIRRTHEASEHGEKNTDKSTEVDEQPVLNSLPSTTLTDKSTVFPVALQKSAPTPPKNSEVHILDTISQISKVDAAPLPVNRGSAFSKTVSFQSTQFIHITARRISIAEYTVTVSRKPPTAIREGIDTTASLALSTLKNLADQNVPLRLTLKDNQQLNVLPKGLLSALGDTNQAVLKAHPFDPNVRFCVELFPPHHTDFCNRCDICDVDLPTKESSDAHFASEDHETAQVLHPLTDSVHQDPIDDSLMIAPAISHHRREEVTCKLCGRKFLDTEPLVAHIRLEHERDHPHSLAPRMIARTAPPLEASRHQSAFQN